MLDMTFSQFGEENPLTRSGVVPRHLASLVQEQEREIPSGGVADAEEKSFQQNILGESNPSDLF
jgi:hypothetical protein